MTLHSTMFLLIHNAAFLRAFEALFTFHDVSINTGCNDIRIVCQKSFTFHDVSINTILRTD